MVYFKKVNIADRVIVEPVFTVKDLAFELGIAPTTVRTWVQWGRLDAARTDNGYQIGYSDFKRFLEKHGPKLRCLPSCDIETVLPYNIEDLTEQFQREEQVKVDRERRQKGYLAYIRWVEATYEARKKLAEHFKDWTLEDLVAIPDSEVAEASGIPIPEGSLKAVEDTTEKDNIKLPNSFESNPHGYAGCGITAEEIKRARLRFKVEGDKFRESMAARRVL